MTLDTTVSSVFGGPGLHADLPAAPHEGFLYSCTTHAVVHKYVAGAWTDWLTVLASAGYTDEQVRDVIGTALVAGSGALVTPNDAGDTITLAADPEFIRDTIAAALVAGSGVTVTHDDAANTITITATGGGGGATATEVATQHNPGTATIYQPGTTDADLDTTTPANLSVTFTAPASGSVLVELSALCQIATNTMAGYFTLREGTTKLAQQYVQLANGTGQVGLASMQMARFKITGLTPGSTHTYKFGAFTDAAAAFKVHAGGVFGPAIISVRPLA